MRFSVSSGFIPVENNRGIFLPQAGVWLDPQTARPLAIVTHGHSDHVAPHGTTTATPGTAAILQQRYPRKRAAYDVRPYHAPWEQQGHRIELLPAGHILGSAMVHVTRLSDGASLLYTGDFNLRASPAAEPAAPQTADTLIMECTFGRPGYVFPPREEIRQQVLHWCRCQLDDGRTPVLLGYALGKAQEILRLFDGADFPLAVHPGIAAMCQVYETLGLTFPPFHTVTAENAMVLAPGRVLVMPPNAVRGPILAGIRGTATAMLSGWALPSGARFRFRVDAAFPLSDHADFPELLQLVERVQPGRILTTHGFCRDFAATLRRRRWNAWCLKGEDQLEFDFLTAEG